MKWGLVTIAATLVLVAVFSGVTPAQIGRLPIQPIQPDQQSFEIRLVNEMGYPVRVKMVRFGSGRYLEEDLPRGGAVTRQLYAGERVLCVWNRNEVLTLAAQVNVDMSGTLRLRPIVYAYPGGPVPQGAPRSRAEQGSAEPLPRLKLEK